MGDQTLMTRHNLPVPFDFPEQPMLIEHPLNGEVVTQRPRDGYINATLLCQKSGKPFGDFRRLARTQAFLELLSVDMGIPISILVLSIKGGGRLQQGTWVHPQVAMSLGQWLSPEFEVRVMEVAADIHTNHPGPTETRAYCQGR